VSEVLDFAKIRGEAQEIWMELVTNAPEEQGQENAKIILKKIEMIFGRPMKLSEVTEDQVDLMNLALLDMRDLRDSLGK
jgi:hypothetical protein